MPQLQIHPYSDSQNVSLLVVLRQKTVENISAEETGEARWQRRGILLKLQHVDIHVYHLPSLSTHSLFAIRALSIHQKLCGDKQSPLFKLSDSTAIRLACVIGSVKENYTQKMEIINLPSCILNQNTHKKNVVVHSMEVSWIQCCIDIFFCFL